MSLAIILNPEEREHVSRGEKKLAKMSKETKEKIHENLHHGKLEKYGYAMHLPKEEREAALKRAIAADGPTQVFREVNLLQVWHRKNNPKLEHIAEEDKQWIKEQYGLK